MTTMRRAPGPPLQPPAAAAAMLVFAVAAACAPPASPPPRPAAAASPPAEATAPRSTPPAAIAACTVGTTPPARVTVIDAGETPRRVLGYDVDARTAWRFSTTRRLGAPGSDPGMRLDLLLTPEAPRCFAYRVTGGDGVQQGAQAFGHLVVRDRGDPWLQRAFPEREGPRDGARIMHEAWLSNRALTEIQDALLLLPEAPVGKGARWEASRRTGREGLEFAEHWSYALERADGDAIEVAVTMAADAEPQREIRDNFVGDRLVERHDRYAGKLVLRRGAPLPAGSWRGEARTGPEDRPEGRWQVERTFDVTMHAP